MLVFVVQTLFTMLLGEGEDVITILPKDNENNESNPYKKITEKS